MGTFDISVCVLMFVGCVGLLLLATCHYLSCDSSCQRKYEIERFTFYSLVGEHLTFDQKSVIEVGRRQLKEEEAHLSQR